MEAITITQITQEEFKSIIENTVKRVLQDNVETFKKNIIEWFDLTELCSYLPDKPSKTTVYGWIHRNQIPYHKGAKKLRFLKSEIDQWLINGKLIQEIEEPVDFIKNRREK